MSTRIFPSTPELRAVTASMRALVPVLIWGPPGQGKTATIESWSRQWGYGTVETMVTSLREPTDFSGLPTEAGGATEYLMPGFVKRLREHETGVLFIDEINTGSGATMAASLRGIQERVFGDYRLPEGVAIVAAANPIEFTPNGRELSPAMANRFLHVDWQFELDTWLDGITDGFADLPAPAIEGMAPAPTAGRRATVAATIRQYITQAAAELNQPPTDLVEQAKGWPSSRSWENLARVLVWMDPEDEATILLAAQGLIGPAAAHKFLAYLRATDLIDPRVALDTPHAVDTSARADRLFVLAHTVRTMAEHSGDKTLYRKALALLEHIATDRPDIAQAVMTGMLARLHTLFPGEDILTDSQVTLFGRFLEDMGVLRAA